MKWEDEQACAWDSAVRGSEALRTAIKRVVKNEVCTNLGKPAAQIWWDMDKFYGTIDPGMVVSEGQKLGYPLTELMLGVMIHRSRRVLRAEGTVSQYRKPTSSIIAGCIQSTSGA